MLNSRQIAIVCRSFSTNEGEIVRGGAERVVLQLAHYLQSRGIAVEVHQRGDSESHITVDEIPVFTHRSRRLHWNRTVSKSAVAGGANLLIFQEISQAVRPRIPSTERGQGRTQMKIVGINHGVYWDYEFIEESARWLPFNRLPRPILRFELALYRRVAKLREIRGVKAADLTLAFDSGLLRIVQSDFPQLRHKIVRVSPFSDLNYSRKIDDEVLSISEQATGRTETDRELVILVPRNYSLSSGLFWLKDIAMQLSELMPQDQWIIRVAGRIGSSDEKRLEVQRHLMGQDDDKYLSIQGRIQFLGSLGREELASELQSAFLVLIPTFAYEGACLAAVEAISMGKTVIATNVGGLNDTIITGMNGILCQPNPFDIAEAIAEYCSDSEYREALQNSLATWKNFYSLDAWHKDLDHVFKSI